MIEISGVNVRLGGQVDAAEVINVACPRVVNDGVDGPVRPRPVLFVTVQDPTQSDPRRRAFQVRVADGSGHWHDLGDPVGDDF